MGKIQDGLGNFPIMATKWVKISTECLQESTETFAVLPSQAE